MEHRQDRPRLPMANSRQDATCRSLSVVGRRLRRCSDSSVDYQPSLTYFAIRLWSGPRLPDKGVGQSCSRRDRASSGGQGHGFVTCTSAPHFAQRYVSPTCIAISSPPFAFGEEIPEGRSPQTAPPEPDDWPAIGLLYQPGAVARKHGGPAVALPPGWGTIALPFL
jgi:hypothetical protein